MAASSPAATATATPHPHPAPPKTQRGLNKPHCIQCGSVARSRCPYHSCKSCCSKAENPCYIHGIKRKDQEFQSIDSEGEQEDLEEVGKDVKSMWITERENLFISIMEEEVAKGNRVGTTFDKESWKFIRESFSKKTKYKYSDLQLRNKFNQLRYRYSNFKKLLGETGVRYVAATGQVVASEQTWYRLYPVHKMAKRFKKKGCPMYDKLRVIYGDTSATGLNARPSTWSPSNSEQNETNPTHNEEEDLEEDVEGNGNGDADLGEGNTRKRTQSTTPIIRQAKRSNVDIAMQSALNTIIEKSKRKADLLERLLVGSAHSAYSSTRDIHCEAISESGLPRRKFIKESIEALDKLDGIDGAAYSRAIEKFHDDELWREIFLRLPDVRKKDWVLNLK